MDFPLTSVISPHFSVVITVKEEVPQAGPSPLFVCQIKYRTVVPFITLV